MRRKLLSLSLLALLGCSPFIARSAFAQSAALIKDINTSGAIGSTPQEFTPFKGNMYFSALESATGIELWKSDETSQGTTIVKDIYSGPDNSNRYYGDHPHFLAALDDLLIFKAANSSSFGLWRTDGTSAGTQLIRNFDYNFAEHSKIVRFGNAVYFSASDGVHGEELWKSDGTAAGTAMVADVNPSPDSSNTDSFIRNLVALPTRILFWAADFNGHNGLWSSDGTAAGTTYLAPVDSYYKSTVAGSKAYILSGGQLWVTDGKPQGTQLLHQFLLSSGDPSPVYFNHLGDIAVLVVVGPTINVWRSGGTVESTYQIGSFSNYQYTYQYYYDDFPIVNFENKLVFALRNGGVNQFSLIGSDGTSAGTYSLTIVPGNWVTPFNVAGDLRLRVCPTILTQCDVWKTDGTYLGSEVIPGLDNATKDGLQFGTWLGDRAFLAYNDGAHGVEPWLITPPDECPNDPLKFSPGPCGCGASDADDDGDGVLNCEESCPQDPVKLSPGSCGCGLSEADLSGNGIYDCHDPALNKAPAKPKVKVIGDKVIVKMPVFSHVTYDVTFTYTAKAKKTKTSNKKTKLLHHKFKSTLSNVLFPKVHPGNGYVTYRMLTGANESYATPMSKITKFNVKVPKKKL